MRIETALDVLAHADYAVEALGTLPDDLPERIDGFSETQWTGWRDALARCWRSYDRTADDGEFAVKFARFAWPVELWWLVRESLLAAIEARRGGAELLVWLAACESRCGRQDEAVGCLMHALGADRSSPQMSALIGEISPRWARQHTLTPYARTGPALRLEPLAPHHAHALFWQYRDPRIAAWMGDDPLQDLDAAQDWIRRESARPGRRAFAVLHADHGFVGQVGYAGEDECAFIHYWIGGDYQGLGYAVPAVTMACEQAWSEGFAAIYTSCRPENVPSLRTLASSGFMLVRTPPLGGADSDLGFFLRRRDGEAPLDHSDFERLALLCDRLGAPLHRFEARKREDHHDEKQQRPKNVRRQRQSQAGLDPGAHGVDPLHQRATASFQDLDGPCQAGAEGIFASPGDAAGPFPGPAGRSHQTRDVQGEKRGARRPWRRHQSHPAPGDGGSQGRA